MACVAAGSKIYVFGGHACGTSVWYMDVVRTGKQKRKEWKQAKECLNREKYHPLSFSLGNKIYVLSTLYLQTSDDEVTEEMFGNVDDDYCFEVLDTSTDSSCWRSLRSPPFPFGASTVGSSWSFDGSDDQNDESRIFIEARFNYTRYLFVYDVGSDTWFNFEQHSPLQVVEYPVVSGDYTPYYTWGLHLGGNEFAPFPPLVPYTGDLRVLTGLKLSIPQLQQLASASEGKRVLSPPFPVTAETDRKQKMSVACKNSSRCLTGWELESLWTLHCLPGEKIVFWQAIHLGSSRFCTIAFYLHSTCCTTHTYLYARVANFDITKAAVAGGGATDEPIFSAEYGPNKVYLVSKVFDFPPRACCKLQPV